MVAPDRTLAQRRDALQKANRIRVARAELKVLLKTDRRLVRLRNIISSPAVAALELADELEPVLGFRPPADWLDTMPVMAVLLACPSIGPTKARRLTIDAWGRLTSSTRRLGGMTATHRATMTNVLEHHANRKAA